MPSARPTQQPRAESPAAAPIAPPTTAPSAAASPAPIITTVPVPVPPTEAAATTAEAQPSGSPWPWIAGGALTLLLAGGFLFWRKRGASKPAYDYAPAETAAPENQPSPPATLTHPAELNHAPPPAPPAPAPAVAAPQPTPEAVVADDRPLTIQLESRHLSRAMINATLAYRLTLTNRADSPVGPLRIAGDIVSAQASLGAEDQFAPADAALATIHQVPPLAPGESVSLSGELRLPIANILPIRSGSAKVFVPLARFRAEGEDGTAAIRVFVVGPLSEQPGGPLRPFALDRGPGVERGLGQRELLQPEAMPALAPTGASPA